MPSKRPQAPATAVEARTSAASPESAQKAADPASVVPPSARDIVNISSISASVRIPASSRDLASTHSEANIPLATCDIFCTDSSSPRSARAVLRHVRETASACSQAGVPRASCNITCVAPTSTCDTASPPRSIHDSCSVPSRVSSSVPKSPSVRFSVPKNPQLASRSPHTPNAIRSRPQWLRSRPSHHASVCERPQVQCPTPASSCAPSLCFGYFANPHDAVRRMQPSSDKQPANRCRATTPQLLVRPCKPLDMVHRACAMPARF